MGKGGLGAFEMGNRFRGSDDNHRFFSIFFVVRYPQVLFTSLRQQQRSRPDLFILFAIRNSEVLVLGFIQQCGL